MFTPYTMRGVTLPNRIVVSPMASTRRSTAVPNDFHLVHLGAARRRRGLVIAEMTCVSPEGRITPGCAGLWNDEQAAAWRRIVEFVHAHSARRSACSSAMQGRKGSTCFPGKERNSRWRRELAVMIAPSPQPTWRTACRRAR